MINIERYIVCNKCYNTYFTDDRSSTGLVLRSYASKEGWKIIKNKDYCPECVKTILNEMKS